MFESDNSRSILTAGLIRSTATARANAQDADRADAVARAWKQRAGDLSERIAELELALAVKTAHAEGLGAQVSGFIAAHPDSPERRDSGRRYKDGDIKTVGRIRYEARFDAFLADKDISDPTRYRAD